MDVFLTGATGFIGGSVAARLLAADHRVRGLTRDPEKANALRAMGIEPVVGTLDDAALLTREARRADAVVNAANSDHRGAAEHLIAALAGSGKPFLHTSGSSIVGDNAGGEESERVFTEDDVTGGSWAPVADKAARVAIDRLVLDAAARRVQSAVLCNTLIYGHGRGLHRDSVQIPALVRQARASGVARHIGAGRNIWSTVHVDDVAELYLLALERPPAGKFLFVENGESAFGDLTQAIADTLGLGPTESWTVEDAVAYWGYELAVYALASNSRVRGRAARDLLGWAPKHGSAVDWIRDELGKADEAAAEPGGPA